MISLRHKRTDCIGCGACAEIAPAYWRIDAEGLARLRQVLRQEGAFQIGQGFDDDRALLAEAAEQCPVAIIRLDA